MLIVMVCGSDDVHVTSRCADTSVPNVSISVAVAVVLLAATRLRIVRPGCGVTVCTCPRTLMDAEPDAELLVLVAVIVADPAAEPVAFTFPFPSTFTKADPPFDHVTGIPAGVVVTVSRAELFGPVA